jgi:hypothetical protein
MPVLDIRLAQGDFRFPLAGRHDGEAAQKLRAALGCGSVDGAPVGHD